MVLLSSSTSLKLYHSMFWHILLWHLEIISKRCKVFYPTDYPCISEERNILICSYMMLSAEDFSCYSVKDTFSILCALFYFQRMTAMVTHNILHPFGNCLHQIPLMTVPISTHSFTHTFLHL